MEVLFTAGSLVLERPTFLSSSLVSKEPSGFRKFPTSLLQDCCTVERFFLSSSILSETASICACCSASSPDSVCFITSICSRIFSTFVCTNSSNSYRRRLRVSFRSARCLSSRSFSSWISEKRARSHCASWRRRASNSAATLCRKPWTSLKSPGSLGPPPADPTGVTCTACSCRLWRPGLPVTDLCAVEGGRSGDEGERAGGDDVRIATAPPPWG
mmetsp:Transcript_74159/g.229224  ORF Transcript_74159/g.229224 Transcript_74159/m.229224 type:complete len:215 (-) Transcript_74159:29-673(-)